MPSATSHSNRRNLTAPQLRAQHSSVWRAAQFWGLWPALIMVLSQWEAAQLSGWHISTAITAITFAGTLAVYGADRGLQFLRLEQLGERHRPPLFSFPLFGVVIAGLALYALPDLTTRDWGWLLTLGLCGAVYPAVTVKLFQTPPGLKEVLGAFCFTYLIWGCQSAPHPGLVLSFFILGLANFLMAGYQDRSRDKYNEITSLAQLNAPLVRRTAVVAGLIAASGFYYHTGLGVFTLTALAHSYLATTNKVNIDAAFTPLLLTPFL